jgi:hypothetical protein
VKEKAPAPRSAARLETEVRTGLGHSLRGRPVDERHLGCGGTCPPSREGAGGGPQDRLRGSAAASGEPVDALQCERHLRRRRLQPPAKTALRQEVPELIGLGKSFHRERSRVGGALRRFNHESLWPVTSRLAALRKGPGHPPSIAATEATPARWAGLDRSSSCARNSFRVQTSPSGARSSRPRVNSP